MWFDKAEENPYSKVLVDGSVVVDMKRMLQDPKVKRTLARLAAKIKDPEPRLTRARAQTPGQP